MTPDEIVARLGVIADALEALDVRREALYAERVELFAAADDAGVLQKDCATAARVTPAAVAQALRKARINSVA